MEGTLGSVGVGLACGAVMLVFPRRHAEPNNFIAAKVAVVVLLPL